MATDGSVRSFPSRAWTCGSLADGVAACAEIAGISLGPDEANDPVKAWYLTCLCGQDHSDC